MAVGYLRNIGIEAKKFLIQFFNSAKVLDFVTKYLLFKFLHNQKSKAYRLGDRAGLSTSSNGKWSVTESGLIKHDIQYKHNLSISFPMINIYVWSNGIAYTYCQLYDYNNSIWNYFQFHTNWIKYIVDSFYRKFQTKDPQNPIYMCWQF